MEADRARLASSETTGSISTWFGWTEEGEESCREEQPCKEEFLPEIPATEDSVEQETLHMQDGVWQRRVEDAATQQT